MRTAVAFLLLALGCSPTPAPSDAGFSVCAHLAALHCAEWVPGDGGVKACERGLAELATTGITVDEKCLAAVKACDQTGDCSK